MGALLALFEASRSTTAMGFHHRAIAAVALALGILATMAVASPFEEEVGLMELVQSPSEYEDDFESSEDAEDMRGAVSGDEENHAIPPRTINVGATLRALAHKNAKAHERSQSIDEDFSSVTQQTQDNGQDKDVVDKELEDFEQSRQENFLSARARIHMALKKEAKHVHQSQLMQRSHQVERRLHRAGVSAHRSKADMDDIDKRMSQMMHGGYYQRKLKEGQKKAGVLVGKASTAAEKAAMKVVHGHSSVIDMEKKKKKEQRALRDDKEKEKEAQAEIEALKEGKRQDMMKALFHRATNTKAPLPTDDAAPTPMKAKKRVVKHAVKKAPKKVKKKINSLAAAGLALIKSEEKKKKKAITQKQKKKIDAKKQSEMDAKYKKKHHVMLAAPSIASMLKSPNIFEGKKTAKKKIPQWKVALKKSMAVK